MLTQSILAGMLIGIGDIALMSIENRYVSAGIFALALMMIIRLQLPLFTGRVGFVIKHKNYMQCFCILILNTVGVVNVLLAFTLLNPDLNTQRIAAVCYYKFDKSLISLFFAAVLCNILIHLAVVSMNELITIMSIMCFILCGFEHSIADAGFVFARFSWRNLGCWLIIVAGNIVGAILAEFLLTFQPKLKEEKFEEEWEEKENEND
jgi:formate/nitrite transporter FocA (FNT family)